jgi:hypothetical protein
MQSLQIIYGLTTYLTCAIYFYNNFLFEIYNYNYIYPKNIGKKIIDTKFHNLLIYQFQG